MQKIQPEVSWDNTRQVLRPRSSGGLVCSVLKLCPAVDETKVGRSSASRDEEEETTPINLLNSSPETLETLHLSETETVAFDS